MKTNDKKSLHERSLAELQVLLKEKQGELPKVALAVRMGKMKNVHAGKLVRKEMAIIQTIIKEKELTNG